MSFLDPQATTFTRISAEKSMLRASKEGGKSSSLFENLLKVLSLLLIGVYRTIGTTFLGGACRFEPSCSEYANECFHKHNFLAALKLTVIRLSKCRPFGPRGYDPVPESQSKEI